MQLVHTDGTTVHPSFRNFELVEHNIENVTRVLLPFVTGDSTRSKRDQVCEGNSVTNKYIQQEFIITS